MSLLLGRAGSFTGIGWTLGMGIDLGGFGRRFWGIASMIPCILRHVMAITTPLIATNDSSVYLLIADTFFGLEQTF